MEITGKIKAINEVQEVTSSFKKREFVISTNEQYSQDILLEVTQDKTELLNMFKVGDDVTASINIRGREWINPEGVARYFNTIQAWRIVKNEGQGVSNGQEEGLDKVALKKLNLPETGSDCLQTIY